MKRLILFLLVMGLVMAGGYSLGQAGILDDLQKAAEEAVKDGGL